MRTLGVSWVVSDLAGYGELVRRSEAAGFNVIAVPDTQAGLYRDVYVCMAVAAQNSTDARIASLVTNPLTRHAAATAGAAASIRELAGRDRIVIGIGTGDSVAANLGLRPATRVQLAEYVEDLRGLWSGQPTERNGHWMRLRWSDHPLPIYFGAEGLRMLRLAGQLADGAVIAGDIDPRRLKWTAGQVAAGAEDVGRRLEDSFEIWRLVLVSVGQDYEAAYRQSLTAVAAAANIVYRGGPEGKFLDDALAEKVARLQSAYEVTSHNDFNPDNPNARTLVRLGLAEPLCQRLAVIGSPAQCAKRLLELDALGVEHIIVRPVAPDPFEFLDAWNDIRRHMEAG
jgi:alkanesulfonate monooxygenase SsuD/methylene tetrahydromethanopterin reductase-like flavin-dependent oxidoreductase (luciferase family)